MKKIKTDYENAVKEYIKKFEEQTDLIFDFWVADLVGEIACFGDFTFDFSDIKYVVDNSIATDWLIDWHYFVVEYKKCYYNLNSYCKLRRDAEKNEHFSLEYFEKKLLYMRIKK